MGKLIGNILHLQRMSTEDGPGIRTTVFFKGCLLRCAWCHNPESLLQEQQVQRIETNCLGCGSCIVACSKGCIRPGGDFVIIDRSCCDGCGECVEACPAGAIDLLGTPVAVEYLFDELARDVSFFQQSGGGVTLSGGEPALQADFCAVLAERLKIEGIHVALDTCGMTSWSNLAKILPHIDLVLYDLKEMDSKRHETFTGQSNEVILTNLIRIGEFIKGGKPELKLWVRTPLIPNATTRLENISAIGAFLAFQMEDILERWELLAFNNLCREKYRRLGMEWDYADTPLLTQEEINQLEDWAKNAGISQERVIATGTARVI